MRSSWTGRVGARRVVLSVLLILTMVGCGPVGGALRTGAGTAAHNLCSSTFISGRPVKETADELVGALIGAPRALLRYSVDRSARRVEASMLTAHAAATFTPGYGCRLVYRTTGPAPAPLPPSDPASADAFAPATLVSPSSPALRTALDRAFAETPGGRPRRVKAVVIVKDGHVVAERYAPGFGLDTPVLSFSVAKSFTNALLGALVRQGRLDMAAPAPVPEWKGAGDTRAAITPDNLLRMTSGLAAPETGSGFDPASQMLYGADDMGAFAARQRLGSAPGTVWDYTSIDTLLLDRIIARSVGGGAARLRRFAETELFAPLGMRQVTLEFDGAGVFVGASHVYAPARAFARFGQLYLADGVAPDGRRILPEGWIDYSRRSTLGVGYGAGFWTNDGSSRSAAARVAAGFPKDGFFASGNLGQRIYIIPSQRLVIARFGYTQGEDFDIQGDLRLIAATIAALHGSTSSAHLR